MHTVKLHLCPEQNKGHLSIRSMDQGNWTKNLIEMGVIDPEAEVHRILQSCVVVFLRWKMLIPVQEKLFAEANEAQ